MIFARRVLYMKMMCCSTYCLYLFMYQFTTFTHSSRDTQKIDFKQKKEFLINMKIKKESQSFLERFTAYILFK